MFVLKLLIGIFSIVVSVKIGIDLAQKDKNAYLFFNGLVSLCDKILSDLSYKKSNIDKLLAGKFQSSDLNVLLNSYLKNKKLILPNYLSVEEKFLIEDIFSTLGKVDTLSQIKNLEAFKTELIKITKEKYEKYKKFNTLFIKLGFIGGLLVFILVI